MTMATPSRKQPSVAASAFRIFDLSLGQMLWSRRSVFLGVLLGGPVLLALSLRVVGAFVQSGIHINGARVGGEAIFGMMMWLLYIRFIVPVLGVFYGTSLIADEIDDKTITYLFTRPIPRRAVLLGKYLAYLACTILLVLPSVMIVFFLVAPTGGGSIADAFPSLLADLAMLAVGLAAYGAVFAWVGPG
jgi:ABC-type transport system involved in multi-copper enzyme maturation permease subunit